MATTKQPEPDDGESEQDFMDRCTTELTDEGMDENDADAECQVAWDNRSAPASRTTVIDRDGATIRKVHAGETDGSEYVLSDETPDRMGDVIEAAGWRLDNFKRNPIALFGHNSSFPIGRWKDIHIEGTALRAHLELAPLGTSDRIDEIRRLVDAGILKATSVGFRPIKYAALDPESPWDGTRFLEHELVETSLVSVPANPNALAVAKSLDISRDTMALVFGKQAKQETRRLAKRDPTGKQADTAAPHRKGKAMNTSENIIELQGQLNMLRDGLQQHLGSLDNDNVSDEQMKKTDDFHVSITRKQKLLDQYVASERALGIAAAGTDAVHEIRMPLRPVPHPSDGVPRVPAQVSTHKPGDYFWKSLVVLAKLKSERYAMKTPLEVLRDTVGENEKVRAVYDGIVGKAASVPALTTATGWAAELVTIERQAFMDALQPKAVFGPLASRGQAFTFGTNGIISIPSRNATPTIAGSFVGEGAAIPVRQGAFSAITMVPKKLAVITVFSREVSEHSDPAIEGLLRTAIAEDTAVAIDSVLMDSNVATAVRPAGLRSLGATLTPTAAGGFAAVVGDVKLLYAALQTATLGNVRNPVFLMPPALALALSLTVAPNGTFAFPSVTPDGGSLANIPIIVSPNVTADTLFLLDAADFVTASGGVRVDLSDSATLHMEDTTPTAIGTTGTPNAVAAPVRSLYQTDTLAIRMIMPLNWAWRRTAVMVAYITGVTWK
jgi:HK97 family phage major capsid protein/HK97 family phage prohead protease